MEFRIKDWKRLFENNRTRELKRMDWVPVPNRMDGSGYTALVDHPNGGAHLGAWLAILEISSRQKERGTLPHDGAGLSQVLARMSRLPAVLFEEVLPRLEEIGWIERVTVIPQLGAGLPQSPAGTSRDTRAVTEGNGREEKGIKILSSEELQVAWDLHRCYKPQEPQQLVLQNILSMNGQFDLDRFRERHPQWCAYWAKRGWNSFGSLTFWGWIQAGMALAPDGEIEVSASRKGPVADYIPSPAAPRYARPIC